MSSKSNPNIACGIASFLFPGLGQLVQGRSTQAVMSFVLGLVMLFAFGFTVKCQNSLAGVAILLAGFALCCMSSYDAAMHKGEVQEEGAAAPTAPQPTWTQSSLLVSPEHKLCPFCAEEIKFAAIKCKHCGEAIKS